MQWVERAEKVCARLLGERFSRQEMLSKDEERTDSRVYRVLRLSRELRVGISQDLPFSMVFLKAGRRLQGVTRDLVFYCFVPSEPLAWSLESVSCAAHLCVRLSIWMRIS